MRNVVAQIRNVKSFHTVSQTLIERDPGVPGIGIVWGETGFGKTTAAAWLSNKVNAVYVRANATWTPGAMLAAIMREIDAEPVARCAAMMEAIVQRLALDGRPLFVDEADYLVGSPKMLDTLRDLHDIATTPLILIGMKDFQRRVTRREQLSGRVSQWVKFVAPDIEDARVLAHDVCEVEIADDLLEKLHREAGRSVRGLIVGLSRIEGWARPRGGGGGGGPITVKDWGDKPFVMSAAPSSIRLVT